MRAVVQRVQAATVTVGGHPVGRIGHGLVVFVGIAPNDSEAVVAKFAEKVAGLRIFEDADERMSLSLTDVAGGVLCISQFTLYGDVRRGRRPSFDTAAPPEVAKPIYEAFCTAIGRQGIACERGVFGAHMEVTLVNDGPVTLILDSEALELPRRT